MADRMDLDRLRNQVDMLREQLADVTDEAGHEAQRYRASATRRVRGMYGRARHYAHDAGDEVGRQVGRHPIASLLVAFAVGIALGKLMDLDRS
jgi:ElaB/YqjD/DUF883 family membrane-anchored ribosome-binding protein